MNKKRIFSVLNFVVCVFLVFSFFSLPLVLYSQEAKILSSQELTIRAWEARASRQYKEAIFYADRCIERYQKEAEKQQGSLEGFSPRGKEEQTSALNDVGASLFIKGEVFMAQEMWSEAKEMFNRIIDNYSFAQSWDPRGWFWKVAEISRINLEKIDKAMGAPQK